VHARRPLREALSESYFSRTSIAMVKNQDRGDERAISPIATTSLYVARAIPQEDNMRTTLTASALKRYQQRLPADPIYCVLPMLQKQAGDDSYRAANAARLRRVIRRARPTAGLRQRCIKTCSPIIGRNTRHTPCSSCKTAEFYRETGESVKPRDESQIG